MSEMPMVKARAKAIGQIGLFPTTQISDEDLSEIPFDKEMLVTVKMPRNLQQLKLAWALADKVKEALGLVDRDDGMFWLKMKSKHVRTLVHPITGEVAFDPKSISFASMTQVAFNRLFNRMIYVTITELIPGLEEGALRTEIEKMTGCKIDSGKRRA